MDYGPENQADRSAITIEWKMCAKQISYACINCSVVLFFLKQNKAFCNLWTCRNFFFFFSLSIFEIELLISLKSCEYLSKMNRKRAKMRNRKQKHIEFYS